MVPVADGELEFAPSPDHVNVIAETGEGGVELRLSEEQRDRLAKGLREDVEVNIELEDGLIAWEPKRGLYVEDFDGEELCVVLSPEERERAAEALAETPVGT